MLCRSFLSLVILLYVLLRFTDSDYFKLLFLSNAIFIVVPNSANEYSIFDIENAVSCQPSRHY
jgi:hypothetical protein